MTVPPFPADLQLARAAAAGERSAQAEIGRRLAVVEQLCAARNLRAGKPLQPEDLADLAQEVRLKTWQKLGDYAGHAPFEAWVFAFVEFAMRNAVRKRRRQPTATSLDDGADDPRRCEQPQFHDDVYRCLDRLAPLDQQIIRAKFFEGLTLEEVAGKLAMNLNTLKSRYVRALQQMHQGLAGSSEREQP